MSIVPSAATRNGSPRSIGALVAASFVPFAWKALSYLELGSLLPAIAFGALASLVALSWQTGGTARRRGLRIWAAALVAWGIVRCVLQILFVAADLDEAHLRGQVVPSFTAVSLLAVAAGVALWKLAPSTGRGTDAAAESPAGSDQGRTPTRA